MKTIEEAAKEKNPYKITESIGNCLSFNNGFKAGIEFAQQFIDCNDELPTNEEKYLVKIIDFGIGFHPFNPHYNCWDDEDGDDYFTDAKGGQVTHWRPIERV